MSPVDGACPITGTKGRTIRNVMGVGGGGGVRREISHR